MISSNFPQVSLTACVRLSQFAMRDLHPLLMCMPPLDSIGPPLLQTLRLVQELTATVLHGRAALKQTPLQLTRTWTKLQGGQWPLL